MSSTNNKIPVTHVTSRNVGLFVTCLVNVMRPSVGFAALKLLQEAGCDVDVPQQQACCGQPAFNSGDNTATAAIAEQVISAFEHYDYVVVLSGSCAGMLKKHYVDIFADQPELLSRAQKLSHKTFELLSFLADICNYSPTGVELQGDYTYHHSCSGLRTMGVYEQPAKMLKHVEGLNYKPLLGESECCGFGGTFCVKYSDISNKIVTEKTQNIRNTKANYLLGGDVGCLMNMEGKLHRQGFNNIVALHTAEVLAGMAPEIITNATRQGEDNP